MNNKNISITAVVIVFLIAALYGITHSSSTPSRAGGLDYNLLPPKPLTNTNVACTSTSGQLVATSSSRQYLALSNEGTTSVYLSFGTVAQGSQGIRLAPAASTSASFYEINNLNLYQGTINCIASSTSVVDVMDAR